MDKKQFYKYIILNRNNTYSIFYNNERYGTYDDITDALHDRDLLIESDWDIAEVMAQDEKPNKYKTMELPEWNRKPRIYDDRYITKQKSGNKIYFKIQKHVDGVQQAFGYFKTYEEAVEKRDELEANGWVK